MERDAKIHTVKTWPEYYSAVEDGSKPFEVRKNDRDYQVEDGLVLAEYDPQTEQFSKRMTSKTITYVLGDERFVKKGYVILGLQEFGLQEENARLRAALFCPDCEGKGGSCWCSDGGEWEPCPTCGPLRKELRGEGK